jgi:hypothetical protein
MIKRVLQVSLLLLVVALLSLGADVRAADPPRAPYALGLVPSAGEFPVLDTRALGVRLNALPTMVDLAGNLPPVGNQGSLGSCVGWAVGYYYKTFQERAERQWNASAASHQFSPSWLYNLRSTGDCSRDNGMSLFNAFTILVNQGAATLSSFPYAGQDPCVQPSAAVRGEALRYRATRFVNVFSGAGRANLTTLKTLLANGEAVALAVPVYSSFFRVSYASPIVPRHAAGETFYGGHALLAVGYDDAMGGFKVVNSWGTGWGRQGFAYLSYDFVQNDVWEGWVMYDQVEAPRTVEISLYPGWNLVSLPVAPESSEVATVLASLGTDLEEAYTWVADAAGGRWQRYTPGLPPYANSFTQMDGTAGLWMRMARERVWEVRGTTPMENDVALPQGWSLLAYPSAAKPVEVALASLAGKYSTVYGYRVENGQGVWKVYDVAAPETSTLLNIEPGYGYWVNATANCAWSPR